MPIDRIQLQLLDAEEALLELAGAVDIVYFREARSMAEPGPYDVTLVEGSISTSQQLEEIREIRAASRVLVTIGACATAGGIQALRNSADADAFTRTVYPTPSFIRSLATSTSVADHVRVDLELHGCPVDRGQLLGALAALLAGTTPRLSTAPVCVECKRRGYPCVVVAKGEPCIGPVTRTGCGALCPAFGRGCYGASGLRSRRTPTRWPGGPSSWGGPRQTSHAPRVGGFSRVPRRRDLAFLPRLERAGGGHPGSGGLDRGLPPTVVPSGGPFARCRFSSCPERSRSVRDLRPATTAPRHARMPAEVVVDMTTEVAAFEEFDDFGDLVDSRPPNVLIVGEDFVRRGTLGKWLRSAGFHTATCPGPHVVSGCPRMAGDPCPLREWAHVAIVDVSTPAARELYGDWAEHLCTRLPDDRRTMFVHDPDAEIPAVEGHVTVRHPVTPRGLEQAVRVLA